MERMLKRVSRSRKQQQEGDPGKGAVRPKRPVNLADCEDVFRKLLGSAGANALMDLTPRALSRRLCGRKHHDNELYRSNSFKFERFERTDSEDLAQLRKQVSLCDDYSVPVDFVNKRRPLSIGPPPSWESLSPHSDNVEVLELYCDPRDSKAYLEPGEEASGKLYTTPDKEYSHPYTDYSSGSRSGEEEDNGLYEDVGEGDGDSVRATPYYYGDLTSQEASEGRMSPRLDEMSRRHLYETAFDSKISKSDDDLDVDVVTNKSILVTEKSERKKGLSRQDPVQKRPKSLLRQNTEERALNEGMSRLDLEEARPFRAPTPPSSAPLPTKFHTSHCIATVHSAPDIPVRAKDLKLPVKSSKHRVQERPRSCFVDKLEKCPARPRSLFCAEHRESDKADDGRRGFGEILEIKGRPPRRPKYSSTESMATSSSGGSLESIRSSTSEGNRSTSSCESRRSSSLSSHSSDSAGSGTGYHPAAHPLNTRVFQQTQLHILSPISDKSSQEPGSETSENNKNNNSERGSPEENESPAGECQKKRRTPQNRNLINLGLCFDQETHQGSDSGISIESRVGKTNQIDFSDLPFDMPKLRRRRMLQDSSSVQDTSGSATSVDLRDLPFDMPKLRRRLRAVTSNTSSVSQASSSNSFQESTKFGMSRPALSLDLQENSRQRISLGLSLDLTAPPPVETFDPQIPLERQGWYHGAITRLEAETILRVNVEGSYLVRNSESSKQDYSLSLKSARGFMHMRIQQCKDTGKYILGQFSNPFSSIPEMIKHYSENRLPIRGAEHMCLSHPIIEQLL